MESSPHGPVPGPSWTHNLWPRCIPSCPAAGFCWEFHPLSCSPESSFLHSQHFETLSPPWTFIFVTAACHRGQLPWGCLVATEAQEVTAHPGCSRARWPSPGVLGPGNPSPAQHDISTTRFGPLSALRSPFHHSELANILTWSSSRKDRPHLRGTPIQGHSLWSPAASISPKTPPTTALCCIHLAFPVVLTWRGYSGSSYSTIAGGSRHPST